MYLLAKDGSLRPCLFGLVGSSVYPVLLGLPRALLAFQRDNIIAYSSASQEHLSRKLTVNVLVHLRSGK